MYSQRAQVPVMKQGRMEKGNWSTRVLTIDVATGTLTISRRNHPNNVLYHSLQVSRVQMWPRFGQACTEDSLQSINAKMTLRVIGKVVPVPNFTADATTVTEETMVGQLTAASPTTASPTGVGSPNSQGMQFPTTTTAVSNPSVTEGGATAQGGHFAFTAGNSAKKSRVMEEGVDGDGETWMLQFTTFKSYELTLVLLQAMSRAGTVRKHLLGPHVLEDFIVVREAWNKNKGIAGLTTEEASLA